MDDRSTARVFRRHLRRGAELPPPARRQELAGTGWFGLTIPGEQGGIGLGQVETVLLARELGRVLHPPSDLDALLVAELLAAAGSGLLRAVCQGELRVSFTALEHGGESAGAPPRLRVDPAGTGWQVSGQRGFAGESDLLVLPLSAENGEVGRLIVLPSARAGITVHHQPNLAGRALYRVELDAVKLVCEDVVALPDADGRYERCLANARLRHAAYLTGLAAESLLLAAEHAGRRTQFGGSLLEKQGVAFPLARMSGELRGLWLLVLDLAQRADVGRDIRQPAAQVLATAARLSVAATSWAVHVHGAAGLRVGTPVERYFRCAAVDAAMLGAPAATAADAAALYYDGYPGRRSESAPPRRQRPTSVDVAGAVPGGVSRPCVHKLFEAQARRTPDAVALSQGVTHLTYRSLNRRADALAQRLRHRGVGPDVVVAICLDRSPELVIAILAVLKAGGAYLPLDPALPPDRLRLMFTIAGATCAVAEEWAGDWLPASISPMPVDHGTSAPAEPVPAPSPENLIYVMFTSGTGGAPKAVAVTHAGISNRISWDASRFPLDGSDAVLQLTSIGFDPSVWEIFAPLCSGARIVLPLPGVERDPDQLIDLLAQERVTALTLVPALLSSLLDQRPGLTGVPSLKWVFCGGDTMSPGLPARFAAASKARLHNMYGPTEASIDALWWPCDDKSYHVGVPVGVPIDGVGAEVLDERGMPSLPGFPGELCLTGRGLARGYLHDPARTAERFVPRPAAAGDGGRMYRTGDLAFRRVTGEIELLGRTDRQLKLNGVRIDPQEVELALRDCPGIDDAVVVRADGPARLVGYVTGAVADGQLDAVRNSLRGVLPRALVPAQLIRLDRVPTAPSGKTDYAALATTGRTVPRPATRPHEYESELEHDIAALFAQILEVDSVRPDDDFFVLGGDSLRAARLVSAARDTLGLSASVTSLVTAPSVRGWLNLIQRGDR
ncbi:amino acid adenylation domain-containing protein [Amycolatopsis sp. QT-25]|uniref:amino acid adenylation domain-containing protein n=1 Tax=Amycolatopsis sp. QT-25 TaxID=3034022 RepID=UPI0023ECDCB6|nr:amino acid adenylation domain-containing protein [Amycolatopsis sp. QT-25]WET81657.1 amino acid adenylation domain-containing protein [Amycolatopsis sp. QT-25]